MTLFDEKETLKYLLSHTNFLLCLLSLSGSPSLLSAFLSLTLSILYCFPPFTLSNSVFLCFLRQSLSDSFSSQPLFLLSFISLSLPSLVFLSLSL